MVLQRLDLVFGTGQGAWPLLGAEWATFEVGGRAIPGTQGVPASQLAEADFDGDGVKDLAVSCKVLSCIFILIKDEAGRYVPALTVDVPADEFLAAGDIDGDGHADLVGSGKVLWTALSSRAPVAGGAPELEGERKRIDGVVINEIMAINHLLPLDLAGGKKSDWIELYNSTRDDADLAGTTIVLDKIDDRHREFTIPEGTTIAAGDHLVLIASVRAGPLNTGFKLPGAGGTLSLLDAQAEAMDSVTYTRQRENVSYGRFLDATQAFVFDLYPSPGESNKDNGPASFRVKVRSPLKNCFRGGGG